jgi:CheY-like chemotaxis protein
MSADREPAPLVLVADDDPDVCAFVVEVLESSGFRTEATTDPEAVVGLTTAHRPALLVVDIMMPRLDGYTLATRLRSAPATEHVPILFITGAPDRIYRTLSFGVGGVAHLQKPFTPAQLLELVHQVAPPAPPNPSTRPPERVPRPGADTTLRCGTCQQPIRVEEAMVTDAGVAHRSCPEAAPSAWPGRRN